MGNFVPSKENLYVGDLTGNQFQIILRDVKGASEHQVINDYLTKRLTVEESPWLSL